MRRSIAVLVGAGLSVTVGCTALLDFSRLDDGCETGTCDGPDGGNEGTVGSDGGNGGNDTGCPSNGGPTPVRLTGVTADGGHADYCIDSTEVTQAQYAEFLKAIGAGPAQAPDAGQCIFKVSYTPNQSAGCTYDPVNGPAMPVACVDWCDAYAFCAWAGKRLCGAVGGGTEAWNAGAGGEPGDEWVDTCSGNTASQYPWGGTGTGDPSRCNTTCREAGAAMPVPTNTNCSTTTGVFDLGGNVREWSAPCFSNDSNAICETHGDSFSWVGSWCSICNATSAPTRGSRLPDVGFRCCSDPR